MLWYITRRLLWTLGLMLLVSTLTFVLFFVVPSGDPAAILAGPHATPHVVREVRHNLGLDRPLTEQYWRYLRRLVLHLDLGYSYGNQQPVRDEILDRLPATLSLTAGAVLLWLALGVALGVLAAAHRREFVDRVIGIAALLAISGPVFVFGYLLLFLFGSDIGKLPLVGGAGSYTPITQDPGAWLDSLVLPWVALALPFTAVYARFTRAALIDVLDQDFIRAARAKGIRERRVLWRHGLRNALVPIVALLGLDIGQLLGGVVFIEAVFNLPGIGTLAVDAIHSSDLPTMQGVVLVSTFFVAIANLGADIAHAYLDPRIDLVSGKRV